MASPPRAPHRRVALVSLPHGDLLQRPNHRAARRLPPLGLLYLQASCCDLARVGVFDGELYGSVEALARGVRDFRPDMVGVSTHTATWPGARRLARELVGEATLVAGGPYATARDEEVLGAFELVVRGEGEQTLRELLLGVPRGQIAGLSFVAQGQVVRTSPRALISDLDAVPPPRWQDVGLGCYRHHRVAGRRRRAALVITSRGCGHGCAYCCDELMHGGRVRRRSSESVIAELRSLRRHHDIGFVEFADDVFPLTRERRRRLLPYLARAGLRFSVNARPDTLDEAEVQALARAGCHTLFLGVEAADPGTLSRLGRRGDAEGALATARLARRHGLRLVAGFMIGAPGEGPESIRRTVALARRLNPDKALFNIVRPHPGTRLYHEAVAARIIPPDFQVDARRYPGAPPGVPTLSTVFSRAQLQELERQAYRAFYGGPRYLARQLLACKRPADLALLAGRFIRLAAFPRI